jgi:UDP-galactopyranose mutase
MLMESPSGMISNDVSLPTNISNPDLVCFSHLRWDFVFQRPQHLLSRAARDRRVFFVEEPVFDEGTMRLEIGERDGGVQVVVPHLPNGLCSKVAHDAVLRDLVLHLLSTQKLVDYVTWYYTPMALSFTSELKPSAVIYDCMDELSAFKGAPRTLQSLEQNLFQKADLVFTGGRSLYEAKQSQHRDVHCFPSSIDREHFMSARTIDEEPDDQKNIPHPRLGFFGVIDERFDVALLDEIAKKRPDWNFVMLGPVVKIDPEILPKHDNIHYLGGKSYKELPRYIAGWDAALLLFADNEATKFISPTKTPEYLAAGKPVVSTPITDVIRPYGEMRLVEIASGADEFIAAIERVLDTQDDRIDWLTRVDDFLSLTSWDDTWSQMSDLINEVVQKKSSGMRIHANNMITYAGPAGI